MPGDDARERGHRSDPPGPCATLLVRRRDDEWTEGFADMGQASLWALAHLNHDGFDSVVPDRHESPEAVKQLLADDPAALGRFLARCGHGDDVIAAELSSTGADIASVINAARDELAVMAEYDDE